MKSINLNAKYKLVRNNTIKMALGLTLAISSISAVTLTASENMPEPEYDYSFSAQTAEFNSVEDTYKLTTEDGDIFYVSKTELDKKNLERGLQYPIYDKSGTKVETFVKKEEKLGLKQISKNLSLFGFASSLIIPTVWAKKRIEQEKSEIKKPLTKKRIQQLQQ
ncbi:MAG: hypothetical protein IJ093_03245 [Bacilli bacterium]|nr:hypothetical protein [Bacilli bacterium]